MWFPSTIYVSYNITSSCKISVIGGIPKLFYEATGIFFYLKFYVNLMKLRGLCENRRGSLHQLATYTIPSFTLLLYNSKKVFNNVQITSIQ